MRKLLSYLKPYWKSTLLAPILMFIEVTCDLLQPTLLASIVDNGVAKGNLSYIIRTGGLMLCIALIGMVGGMGCTLASSISSQHFGADLRSAVFKKIQSFSFSNIDRFKTSSLITRLTNDITQLQMMVLMSLRMMIRAPLLFIGGIIMAISLNAKLSLILVVSIPLLILVLYRTMKKSTPLFSMMQQKLDRVNAVIRENLSGVRVIKAFVRAEHEKNRFATANDDLMQVSLRAFGPHHNNDAHSNAYNEFKYSSSIVARRDKCSRWRYGSGTGNGLYKLHNSNIVFSYDDRKYAAVYHARIRFNPACK